jgi:hypothetical protein
MRTYVPFAIWEFPRMLRKSEHFLAVLNKWHCKELQIISAPLHVPTKITTQFPKPWLEGTGYDLAFHRVKALLLDERLYLHHKDPSKILYIEVDASDVGWGACAYQMRNSFEGDPKDEARMRVGDTGSRNICLEKF